MFCNFGRSGIFLFSEFFLRLGNSGCFGFLGILVNFCLFGNKWILKLGNYLKVWFIYVVI